LILQYGERLIIPISFKADNLQGINIVFIRYTTNYKLFLLKIFSKQKARDFWSRAFFILINPCIKKNGYGLKRFGFYFLQL
jgi:hypothetical protein